nr:transporter [Bacteroidota bacterium]
GWAQASFPQFSEDVKRGLVQDGQRRKWKFEEPESLVKVRTFGEMHPTNNFRNVELVLNGVPHIFTDRLCGDNSMNGVAFNKSSLSSYLVINRRTCGRFPMVVNNFSKIEIEGDTRFMNSFFDAVENDDYVLMFSIGRVTFETWPTDVKQKLRSIGASDEVLNALKNGDPYIILGRKGAAPGTAIEITGEAALGLANTQEIILEEILKGHFTQGTIASTRIGPAVEWGILQRNIKEQEPSDVAYLDVFGIDFNGNESILMKGIMDDQVQLTAIDPVKYPYLRLRATVADETNFTPPQLEKWHVLYTGVPEGVITLLGDKEQPLQNIKLQAGQALNIKFNFRNISEKDFADSIVVRYTVFNRTRRSSEVKFLKLPAIKALQSHDFTVPINTSNGFGINDVNVFVNPQLQPEQYYNNNIIDLPQFFEIHQDNTNQVLDVAFDGMYIMDGDIVSPNPIISIKVKDENKFILKKDTTGVEISLKRPCESCMFEKVNFSDANIKWETASENKDFNVEYQPKELEDGIYTLQVQAVDGSGNKTGLHPYSVNFEVINKSEITNFYPYPNPFSTNTRFIFTLTGSEIPQEIKIQIMTVTGKIVREITQDELGPIRIGNNISQFAWNGRDEFGDQLANGVYLYKVVIKNNGFNMDQRATAADKAFKKGFGKLYLLR